MSRRPTTPLAAALREVDQLADRFHADRKVPGFAYGVIVGGELVHSRGIGTRQVGGDGLTPEGGAPDADTVFRIASMTKSFTAVAILLLRDEGRLTLDDPVARHVPDLAGLHGPTVDSPVITIRHLLTMTAGFPTDDPWGDRQQGLAFEAFGAFLRGGQTLAWTPGLRFDYSNLGYGILGRVVTNATGQEYREFVRDRLLVPLGMVATTYLEQEVPADRLASGYVWRDDRYQEEPIDPYGALSSMGGVFSTVRDLARWVAGFTEAFPPRDDEEAGHPLSRATRREMQQGQRAMELVVEQPAADGVQRHGFNGYGFGLFVQDDLRFGRIVGHSGGYPGYGSNMRWQPASGVGVVVLGNARYAPSGLLSRELHEALLAAAVVAARRLAPAKRTLEARAAVELLLEAWDDELADRWFAMNIELDEPVARRRAAFDRLRDTHGRLTAEADTPIESMSAAHVGWWLRGERGRVRIGILLTPERPARIQALDVTSVPEPPPALADAAASIGGALGAWNAAWPSGIALAIGLDREPIERAFRATAARYAPLKLGPPIAGDGEKAATWRLVGERGSLDLQLEMDPAMGELSKIAFVPVPLVPPPLAD